MREPRDNIWVKLRSKLKWSPLICLLSLSSCLPLSSSKWNSWIKLDIATLPAFLSCISSITSFSCKCCFLIYHIFIIQRNGGWSWGGGNLSSMSASVSTLGDTGWLIHVQSLLAGSAWIAAHVALEFASVLVHCRLYVSFDSAFVFYLYGYFSFDFSGNYKSVVSYTFQIC